MELEIVLLIRACWIVGVLLMVMGLVPISKLSYIRELVLGFAGRGKILHLSSSSKIWTVPQRFFAHFYIIGVAWTTLLLATTSIYAFKTAAISPEELHSTPIEHRFKVSRAVFLLLLMETQVLRRLIESIYLFKYSPSAKMHIFGYLAGIFFYTAAPLSLCLNVAPEVSRFVVNQVVEFITTKKGYNNNNKLSSEFNVLLSISPLMKLGSLQWIGGTIFLWGWIHQLRCHAILGSLRKNPSQVNEYIVPHGDWFEIISCPHYLAEIVLYFGLLVASGGGDITIWLIFCFVVGNLTLAARETHQWYIRKFENYPANRCAIFPYAY
ncbi:unnamed protein product [Cochlearia groenlandica]